MPLINQPDTGEKRCAVPRDSATLVLMRDMRNGAGSPEVLLAQRHARDVFAASAFVFPGGVLDPLDMQPTALALSPDFSVDQAFARLEEVDSPEKAVRAAIIQEGSRERE